MSSGASTSDVRRAFVDSLDHPVDDFQVTAMDSLDDGASVLVAAPTGSGKTLVAEYAIVRALASGSRAFYTAPLKALSNQKYRDLAAVHGHDRVGLVTGDNAINPDARVVVMTTEVLRNMIYTGSSRLDDLAVVVLDEVHFLQDAYRGPVWEEVIIQLPPEVQLVCLSATVSNATEVAEWLSTVRGRTDPVVEHTRPVELLTHFAYRDSATNRVEMLDTIVGGEPNRHLQRLMASTGTRSGRRGGGGGSSRRRFFPPSRTDVVDMLESRSMLPAIVFIFSRAQCEDAVRSCARDGLVLTSADEEDEIIGIVEEKCAVLSDDDRDALDYAAFLETVGSGIACHHAGMIPMFKEAVEECFVRGLVKVVFATETLAVGINMPAKAVVIEKLTKYTGEHHALLRASEYAQLTGRAGRRGLDDIGHAVTLWSPWVTFDQAAGLALSRSFRLSSAFRPTFNMAANMIAHHTREATMHVLNLSFAQFQADRDVVTTEALLERKRRELAMLEHEMGWSSGEAGHDPVVDPEQAAGAVETEIAMRALRPGDVVVFDAANVRGRGLVLATAARRSGVRLTVLLPSRKIVEVTGRDLRSLPRRAATVMLPVPYEPARTEFLREASARLVRARVDESVSSRPVVRDRTDTDSASSGTKAVKRLRREVESLASRAEGRSGSVYGRFVDVTDVLAELGYVDGWSLLPKGRALATIFHESDLLVVEVMSSGALSKLSAVDLVGVVSSLVFEPRGADAGAFRWPNDTVRNRIKRIEKISERLHDVEKRHGLHLHRSPHPGLSWESSAWASGRPLSRILDPELTPGDFVRSMRQLIDLLRQIAVSSDDPDLRQSAQEAARSIDRGVVAAAAAGGTG